MTDGIYPITIPKWGIEMQEGTVVCWHVEEGQELSRGDELIDVETDKIVNTMEAPSSGLLRRILAAKGETLKVGALLGVIASSDLDDRTIDEFIAGFKPAEVASGKDEGSATSVNATARAHAQAPAEPQAPGAQKVRISPAAAQRARELGVDISEVTPTGRRISPQDVERHAQSHGASGKAGPETRDYEARPLSATRQSIARKLVEAKQQIPHFYLSMDITMDDALDHRDEINARGGQKVSINDLLLRAVVLALQSVPDVNIHLVGDEIRRFNRVNLAVAVATERGIITPVIHEADTMTMVDLARQADRLAERARDASLTREDLAGGTFTVSNLGMYGISEFQAIINPPQGAILALGSCERRVVPGADSSRIARVIRVTLSCDHRAIDGALGAQFLSHVKANLENPKEL